MFRKTYLPKNIPFRICDGTKQPEAVLREQIAKYKEVFAMASREVKKLDAACQKYLNRTWKKWNLSDVCNLDSRPCLFVFFANIFKSHQTYEDYTVSIFQ